MPRKTTVESEALTRRRQKLGATLRKRRIDLGFSQEDIAATGAVDRSSLSRIETGGRTYSIDYLLILDELYTKLEEVEQDKQKKKGRK